MLQQVKAEFDAKGLPLAYYQLDAYWYHLQVMMICFFFVCPPPGVQWSIGATHRN